MRPLIKICGLTRADDAHFCHAAGADLLGVIFAASPRQVSVGQAAAIRSEAPNAILVGVFTDQSVATIAGTVAAVGLDLVQLHACDDPERWAAVARATGVPILPAVTASQADAAVAALQAHPEVPTVGLLLDLPKTAAAADDDAREALLAAARRCADAGVRVLLAGALDATNVGPAMQAARPYGLDVCRGVESAPGLKDYDLVERFLAAADQSEVDRVS